MNTTDEFMIQEVKYDNFNNKLVKIITNKNLAKEFVMDGQKKSANVAFLSTLEGEEKWITVAEFTQGVKGSFKIRKYKCYSYDGRELCHPLSSLAVC